MVSTIVWALLVAGQPVAKLEASVGKEMTEAIVSVNKALGLETWTSHGVEPCIDRGGLEATANDVGPEETRQCASTAVAKGFGGLGRDYVLGIPMASIGPVTVFAIGIADSDGWGAYSCDPSRKCAPTKLGATSKQAKRLVERYRKACADPKTVWFPDREQVCADVPMSASAESKPEQAAAPAAKPSQTIQTKLPADKPENRAADAPWPTKQ